MQKSFQEQKDGSFELLLDDQNNKITTKWEPL